MLKNFLKMRPLMERLTTGLFQLTYRRRSCETTSHFKSKKNPEPMSDAIFSWGTLDASAFIGLISSAYTEIVHWKRNVFPVPHGRAGIDFVLELARLFTAYGEASALESIALKGAFVRCGLLLQLPHRRSKPREQLAC